MQPTPFITSCITLALILNTSPLPLAASQPAQPSPARALLLNPSAPLVIAHRGFSRIAPENTLPSFRLALASRADLVELDYHHTSDGVPVVIHDGTLDRTTDATRHSKGRDITVVSRTSADLAALDAGRRFHRTFTSTRIPTLVQALETIQAGGITLIERKGGDAATLAHLLRDRHWLDQVVVQSFDWSFVRDLHRLAPDLVLGALGPPSIRDGRKLTKAEKELNLDYLTEIARLGANVVVWNRQVSQSAIALAREHGLRVWIYTINDPTEAAALVRLGADGIITDDPAAIRARLHPQADDSAVTPPTRRIPEPLPDHPGNIVLEGMPLRIRLPEGLSDTATRWRLVNDRGQTLRAGKVPSTRAPVMAGQPGPGWYRLELNDASGSNVTWTTAAVLTRLAAPIPGNSPICVDSATSWFAPDDPPQQERLANLAALAGVNWVRDRLRWRDLQPAPGPLTNRTTTYDTAAQIQYAAGLKVLQVFHDTPPWARENPEAGGRFAPDLRHLHQFTRSLASRFKGHVQSWEPWNEANVSTFGAHTVDQMASWQKAAWLGFKASDPGVIVGWNVTTAVPTEAHTEALLANETAPYFDTYNIHTYDWAHAYADLWPPARQALSGKPLWITEADRGTPHLNQAPWFDQDPHMERLKAEFIAQSYASSLFAGATRHFHFILGHYHEPSGVQFGLLRRDLTPRPAYVALATVGRCLAGARILGRWRPAHHAQVVAFRAFPDGREHDVLVAWAEQDSDWKGRGKTSAELKPPIALKVEKVVDHLGRTLPRKLPDSLSSAPVFVYLPPGQAAMLPLEPPPPLATPRQEQASSIVLQLSLPQSQTVRIEDVPWSEAYAYTAKPSQTLDLPLHLYNFSTQPSDVRLAADLIPTGWSLELPTPSIPVPPMGRETIRASLHIPGAPATRDGLVRLHAITPSHGRPALAFRVVIRD